MTEGSTTQLRVTGGNTFSTKVTGPYFFLRNVGRSRVKKKIQKNYKNTLERKHKIVTCCSHSRHRMISLEIFLYYGPRARYKRAVALHTLPLHSLDPDSNPSTGQSNKTTTCLSSPTSSAVSIKQKKLDRLFRPLQVQRVIHLMNHMRIRHNGKTAYYEYLCKSTKLLFPYKNVNGTN